MCISAARTHCASSLEGDKVHTAYRPATGIAAAHSNACRAVGDGRGPFGHAAAAGNQELSTGSPAMRQETVCGLLPDARQNADQWRNGLFTERCAALTTACRRTIAAEQDVEVSKAMQELPCHKWQVRSMAGPL